MNIYNNYFCCCIGKNCSFFNINQETKYKFYLNVIDNNRDIYNKTDYLFVDFIFEDKSSDDTYPVFKEMEKENWPVHYVTEFKNIYNEYCNQNKKCLKIIPINKTTYELYGDFLEIYLTLLLKLKAVISAREGTETKYSQLFYNLEYVTYIAVGHGVCYFKDYLYADHRIYGQKKNDKILIPPSEKIISIAKKYGWKDENIIKMNLPRWDKFNNFNNINNLNNNETYNNSIFVMFTWRFIKKRMSPYYFINIIRLLKDSKLRKELELNNITLYLTFHRFFIKKYFAKTVHILKFFKYIKNIKQNQISDVLAQTDLVVTDFSSIVFDLMYRRKPFVIYIPDTEDPSINKIYSDDYHYLIKNMRNGNFHFENIFFNIKEAVDKIIYYISNKFQLDTSLEKLYDSFSFKKDNNVEKFIEYLKTLK